MAKTYSQIKAEADAISNATGAKSITKTAVGGAIADVLDFSNNESIDIKKYHVKRAYPFFAFGNPNIYISQDTGKVELDSKTLDELYAEYDSLCELYPDWIRRNDDFGTDSSGLPMRMYTIRFYDATLCNWGDYFTPNSWTESCNPKKILIAAGVHGNEKSSTWAVMLAVKDIVTSNEEWAKYLRNNFTIVIMPCNNPWGFNNLSRNNYNNVNINRDYNNKTQPETQAITSYFEQNKEDIIVALDSHNATYKYPYYLISTKGYVKMYAQTCAKIAAYLKDDLSTFFGDNKKPYVFPQISSNTGTFSDYINEQGVFGHTIEYARNDRSNGETSGETNNSHICKIGKELVVNTAIAYSLIWNSNLFYNYDAEDTSKHLTLLSQPEDGGSVIGAGTYEEGTIVQISATKNNGYVFEKWSDGDTNATKSYTIPQLDSTLTAQFKLGEAELLDEQNAWVNNSGKTDSTNSVYRLCQIKIPSTAAKVTIKGNSSSQSQFVFTLSSLPIPVKSQQILTPSADNDAYKTSNGKVYLEVGEEKTFDITDSKYIVINCEYSTGDKRPQSIVFS